MHVHQAMGLRGCYVLGLLFGVHVVLWLLQDVYHALVM